MLSYLGTEKSRNEVVSILNLYGGQAGNVLGRFPKNLYKYCGLNDYSISNIKNNVLFTSSPQIFNDCFDSRLHINRLPILLENQKEIHRLSKLINFDDSDIDFGLHNQQIMRFDSHMFESFTDNLRILCLSELNKSNLMWSHYADYNKGICIEYSLDISEFDDLKKYLYPVIYRKVPFDITHLCEVEQKVELAVLLSSIIKSEEWSYEREWRFIIASIEDAQNVPDRIEIRNVIPQSIILGSQFFQPIKDDVQRAERYKLNSALFELVNNRQLPIYMMMPKIGTFDLEKKALDILDLFSIQEDDLEYPINLFDEMKPKIYIIEKEPE